eukprot:CAMPEP_0201519974 /NCGR_PEP_ID=MMETSP0161_2-20130828/10394_1 /ASSEMBLY_ACC=CAM_ASM_000251 /TAXON_ID=180227 /ORGANISM="Neoparamoeba aestuarina, Strain SoJaBio B1-5/56/2" /LENGTH=68 /DNA_ID=CAMNT_0047918183 /DNA_START=136 /DNA_END=342 /DNA_ORIENTATION=+
MRISKLKDKILSKDIERLNSEVNGSQRSQWCRIMVGEESEMSFSVVSESISIASTERRFRETFDEPLS